jgi:23S rRNA (adenine2503-C2)-methyltransferase
MSSTARTNLLGLPRPELEAFVAQLGSKPFRARQLMNWVYKRGEGSFDNMTDLAKDFRAQLNERALVHTPEVVIKHVSADDTCKWVLRADSSQAFEMVFIPEADRGTLCISSQVGCALDCSFCSTAQQGFNRNLTTAEIVGQVWLAKRELAEFDESRLSSTTGPDGERPNTDRRVVTNVVLMGMGEPLANFRNVVPALRILLDDFGFDLSRRRVTLSTSGLVPQIYKLAEETNVALAVSLHAPSDELRNELVPINRKHPIAELLTACWHYIDEQNGRSVTFEYVMLDGINDSPAQARALAQLLRGHPAKVNLIPFNPFPGTRYERSPASVIQRFRDELIQRGVLATVRRTRGDDIDAACGQLAGRVIDRTTARLGNKVFGVAVSHEPPAQPRESVPWPATEQAKACEEAVQP